MVLLGLDEAAGTIGALVGRGNCCCRCTHYGDFLVFGLSSAR